jgi:hypothetical protein
MIALFRMKAYIVAENVANPSICKNRKKRNLRIQFRLGMLPGQRIEPSPAVFVNTSIG